MLERGQLSSLVFISTLALNGSKLDKNCGLIVILGFMPSHRPVLMSLYDSSLVLTGELRFWVHNGAMVIARPAEINSRRLHIDCA